MAKTAEVASQIARPLRSALIQSPLGTRTPEVVPFQVKTTSRSQSTWREIGQLAVGRVEHARVLELQLLDDVGDPALAEALPGQHVDAARAEQRPQRHLDRAGIGGGHDAEAIILGHAEQRARAVEHFLQAWPCRAWSDASGRRARSTAPQATSRDAWRRDRKRNWGMRAGVRLHDSYSFRIDAPRWGGVSRARN